MVNAKLKTLSWLILAVALLGILVCLEVREVFATCSPGGVSSITGLPKGGNGTLIKKSCIMTVRVGHRFLTGAFM